MKERKLAQTIEPTARVVKIRTLAIAMMARLAAFSGLMFIMRLTTLPFCSLDCAQ